MDTSKEFILMCEKAEEIQKIQPKVENDLGYGSFFYDKSFNIENIAIHHWDNDEGRNIIGCYNTREETLIWLPRQDQLQDMMKLPFANLMDYSHDKYYSSLSCYSFHNSFEKFWLAFVMKEKYNKVWDGKDWVKSLGKAVSY